jgi:membrane fusion protein, multidrug efflux system
MMKTKMQNKFFPILILASLVMMCGISCKNGKSNADAKKETPPVSVDVIIAGEKNVPTTVEVNGTVISEEMIELHPEVSGRITYLNIPDGAQVSAGTVLAKINDADLQAQMEQQKVQLDLATKTEQRLKSLLAVNGVNQAEYDAALSQVNTYQANINVLKAQIDKTVIKASFSGKLGLRLISLGAYVTPQTLIGTLQTDQVKIDFTLPDVYENYIKIGDEVAVQESTSEENLTAVISAIEPQINTSTRNIKVRARLKSGHLNPGAFVKVLITEKSKGIVVPSNAVIPEALSNQVIVVKKGKAVFKNVETGVRTENLIEITKGLNSGDSIVVSGVLYVRPNAKVIVKKVKKIEDK